MDEYGGNAHRVCRRSRRLSSARLDGVVISIRGDWVVDSLAGRRRSWKMSSMRVWVLPV
jgi:hypothetical protein